MAIVFNTLLSGWISEEDRERVQSTYSENFRKVAVYKRDANGSITSGRYEYLQNTITRDFYFADSPQLVAFKCFEIALVAPIYTTARIVFHIFRSIYLIGVIFMRITRQFSEDLELSVSGYESFYKRFFVNLPCDLFKESFLEQAWECIKAPYYGLGLFIAACEGLLHDPYKAKMEISLIERYWNGGKSRHHDWRIQKLIHKDLWQGILHSDAFFIAYCMQCKGNENDVVKISKEDRWEYKYSVQTEEAATVEGCIIPPLIPTACC